MDQLPSVKSALPTEERGFAPIRVSARTQEVLRHLLLRANDKDLGRKVKADEIVNVALSLVLDEQIKQLQVATFNNADRLELSYRRYIKEEKSITKDEFIGRILNGEIVKTTTT